MGTLMKTVVFLFLTSTVLCTPFINQLQPGQEWPTRSSVKQPKPEVSEQQANKDVNETELLTPSVENEDTTTEDELNSEKVDYSGCQVWKVSTKTSSAKKVIHKLASQKRIVAWGGNHTTIDVLVKPEQIANVTNIFKKTQLSYEIMIDDLQRRINEENPPLDDNEIELQDRQGHRMTWSKYHRVADIHDFMDYLAKTYPSFVSVKTIGKSFQGIDLKVLRISDGKASNKAVFIDGGIHAREWISPAVVTYFINQFAENFDTETDDIKNIDWYFLPVVNPDGYEHSHTRDRLWRKNRKGFPCYGTDLNRNFGFHWGGKGSSGNPCSEIYRGSAAFSEPESKALSDFITNSAANFAAYLTYHSYGQYILYPWGYDTIKPTDHQTLQAVGTAMANEIRNTGGSKYTVGTSSELLYPASGGSDDWVKSRGIKYAYTVELSDTGRYGFVLPSSYILPVARENLAGLRVLINKINSE